MSFIYPPNILSIVNTEYKYIATTGRITQSSNDEFIEIEVRSSSLELDKIITLFKIDSYKYYKSYVELITKYICDCSIPQTENDAVKIRVFLEMIGVGNMMNRKILSSFPENSELLFYDFSGDKIGDTFFCTDNGKLLWWSVVDKWDMELWCKSLVKQDAR